MRGRIRIPTVHFRANNLVLAKDMVFNSMKLINRLNRQNKVAIQKRSLARTVSCFAICLSLIPLFVQTAAARSFRVAYFEPGDYAFYRTLQGEYRDALLDKAPKGVKIVFPPDGYKTAEWDRQKSRAMAKDLTRNRNIDLIVTMGPWAVEDLLEAGCKKPIVAMGRFDPVLEGLAESNGRPLYKNLTVRIRPGKIQSDLAALTSLYPAKRIGLLYFPAGKESAVVENHVSRIAEKYGAQIITAPLKPGEDKYLFFKKLAEITNKVDVLYLTPLHGMPLEQINGFFQQLKISHIPAFSSEGLAQVERGAFGSNTAYNVYGLARYHAEKTFEILKGASPQSLPTVFRDGRRLTINLAVCKELGIDPPSALVAEARLIDAPSDPSARLFSVKDAINEASLVNPAYLGDDEALEVSKALIGEKRSEILPQLSANGYARGYADDPPGNAFPRESLGKTGYEITLRQTLFDLSAFKSISLAKKDFQTAEDLREIQKADFEYSVAMAYLNLARAYDVREMYEQFRERTHHALQIALTHFELKTAPRAELVRWEGRKESATVQLLEKRSDVKIASAAFLAKLGRPTREEFTIDRGEFSELEFSYVRRADSSMKSETLRNIAEDFWVMEAIKNSPLLKAAHTALDRSATELSVNTGRALPTVTASVGYFQDNYFDINPPLGVDDNGLIVQAQITAPLFDGGKRLKKRSRIKARMSELGYRLDDATLRVAEAVREDFAKLVGSIDRALFAIRSRKFASEALEANFTEYENEAASSDELFRGLEGELQSQADAIYARYDFFAAQIKLWRDVGYLYVDRNSSDYRATLERLQSYQASQR